MGTPRRRAWHQHLAVRFGLALGLLLITMFVLLGWWNLATQRDHMVRLTGQAADQCSNLVRGATREAMLRVEMDRVDRILGTLGDSPGISRIRLLDRAGHVKSSTVDGEVGQQVDSSEFVCQVCHAQEPPKFDPPRAERFRIHENAAGERFLDVIAPIYNEPSCTTADCHEHPAKQRVLGVIDVEMPLAATDALIRDSEHQLGVGLLAGLTAFLALTYFLTWRMVLRPVQSLAVATEQVGRGDLSARAVVHSEDELGAMTETWNATVEELQTARGQLEGWSRKLEQRVRDKTDELESAHGRMLVVEKMAALGKLAAVVAHEVNNPLAGVATYARLLRRQHEKDDEGCSFSEEHMRALKLMESETQRCGTIVRNLLAFSRTPGVRLAETDLAEIVERCLLLVKHKADLQRISLEHEIVPGTPKIQCDPNQIQQLILALVMNGMESMARDGTLRVRVAPDTTIGGAVLRIEDDGCGIPPDALPHIYEPFFTTKEEGEGVGLGLSVVYGIVERHHGFIDVVSEPGLGTTFHVRLPLTQPDGVGEDGNGQEDEAS